MQKEKKYKEKGQTVLSVRAVRGGSWNNQSDNLSCASRNYNNPDNRNNNMGFRVVSVFSPNHAHRAPRPRDVNLMPVFHGTPDRCPGMTYGPLSRVMLRPLRSQPEYKFLRAASVSPLNELPAFF